MRLIHSCYVLGLIAVLLLGSAPLRAAPQRVVSVNLCTDEYVFRLLPRARIAALSFLAGDTHPVVSTIAGKISGIRLIRQSAEEVFALHPDLVVMDQGASPRLRAHLLEAGVPILEVPWVSTLAGIRKVTRMLGQKLGAAGGAEAMVAQMDKTLAAAHTRALQPRVRTLIYEPNGYATVGGVTDEIMNIAGLSNAAAQMRPTRLGTLPVEAVVAAAPELLILSAAREGTPARADLVLQHPALAALKGHTFISRASLTPLLCPGPWSAETAGEFARMGREARALAARGPRH